MATLIKGLLAFNLDWQFVMVGVALAVTVELCGVGALSFAVGAYLPARHHGADLRGRPVRAFADRARAPAAQPPTPHEAELGPGNLFATGLVAGGAVAGVAVAFLTLKDSWASTIGALSLEHALTGKLGPGRLPGFGPDRLRRHGRDLVQSLAWARLARFELATPGFVGRCSIQMS